MTKNVLFITPFDFSDLKSGGALCSYRNYESLKYLYNNVDLFVIRHIDRNSFNGKLLRNLSKIFFHRDYILNDFAKKQLDRYDLFFIDGSNFGLIAKWLKKKNIKGNIVSFFHNCEYEFAAQFFDGYNAWIKKINKKCIYINEYNALRFSEKCIALNSRDVDTIKKIYGEEIESIIPISLHDKYFPILKENVKSTPYKFLFIGSYFYGNVSGLKWFIKEVLPFVNIQLTVVGKDMDQLRKDINISSKLEIHSNVPDISSYIEAADCIILPVFDGSGMKVKTCESLMYGKYIIGTSEAFEGYELNFEKVGACCNTKMEFISAINLFTSSIKSKYNAYSREVFKQKYSFEATLELFDKTLSDCFNNKSKL